MTTMKRTVAVLDDVVLPDSYGHEIRLGDLWEQRRVTAIWLRHYG